MGWKFVRNWTDDDKVLEQQETCLGWEKKNWGYRIGVTRAYGNLGYENGAA